MSHASLEIEICTIKNGGNHRFGKITSIYSNFTTCDADELMVIADMISGYNLPFS